MTYNPYQSKPYVLMQNNNDSIFMDNNNLPTQVDDYPLDINVDIEINDNNGAGDLNSSTNTFTFGSSAFLFGDSLHLTTNGNGGFRGSTSFTDTSNTQVGVRGQDQGRYPRNTDSLTSTVMNQSPRSTQRSDEFPRLMVSPNTSFKLRFGVLQQDWASTTWNSSLQYGAPAKTAVVFGFIL
jgi:hypothetical protein